MATSGIDTKRAKLDGNEHIVTHNGTHHADEALAVHLLRKLPQYAQAKLTRTRDQSIIDSATIVVDVGAQYDPAHNGIPLFPPSAGQPAYSSKTDLSARVGYLNPAWNETLPSDPAEREADSMRRFERASSLAGGEFFDRLDFSFRSWLPAREIIEKALNNRKMVHLPILKEDF
ncbi:hypothetical protein L7F22_043558 [Adiantum nelumboides]|nr:hypothetical protein [Adiantum nelumboides]